MAMANQVQRAGRAVVPMVVKLTGQQLACSPYPLVDALRIRGMKIQQRSGLLQLVKQPFGQFRIRALRCATQLQGHTDIKTESFQLTISHDQFRFFKAVKKLHLIANGIVWGISKVAFQLKRIRCILLRLSREYIFAVIVIEPERRLLIHP